MLKKWQPRRVILRISYGLCRPLSLSQPTLSYMLPLTTLVVFTIYYLFFQNIITFKYVKVGLMVPVNKQMMSLANDSNQPIRVQAGIAVIQSMKMNGILSGKPAQPASTAQPSKNGTFKVLETKSDQLSEILTSRSTPRPTTANSSDTVSNITQIKVTAEPSGIEIKKNSRSYTKIVENIRSVTEVTRDNLVNKCLVTKYAAKEDITYRRGVWQVENEGQLNELVIYSAYYDDRPQEGPMPWIRLQAIIHLPIENRTDPIVFCQVWYAENTSTNLPYIVEAKVLNTGRDFGVEKPLKVYSQRMYSCNLSHQGKPYPTEVSLVTGDSNGGCKIAKNLLPVQMPLPNDIEKKYESQDLQQDQQQLLKIKQQSENKDQQRQQQQQPNQHNTRYEHEFTICVHTSYGNFSKEHMVEWFEAHRMFGVTRFNIYNATLDSHLDPVFEYYSSQDRYGNPVSVYDAQDVTESEIRSDGAEKNKASKHLIVSGTNRDKSRQDGLLRTNLKALLIFKQQPPAVDDYTINGGLKLNSPSAYNDCMMNNMKSSRFIIPLDYDEIIVPRGNLSNYGSMLDTIDKSKNLSSSHHTYAFRCAYFFKTLNQDESQPKHLLSLRYRKRAPPLAFAVGAKSFVDPRRCLSVFNHYCYIMFTPNLEKDVYALDVPQNFGMLHHYRNKCESSNCPEYFLNQTLDDTMLRFKDELRTRVDRVLSEINGYEIKR